MTLRSGRRVWIRRIRSGDAAELRRAFERLSALSRYRRLHTGAPSLSDAVLRRLVDVDHVDEEALVALPEQGSGVIVGVARFVRDQHDPTTADLAVTVADDWHGQGLGSLLLAALADRARELGVDHLTADMLAENRAVLALVRAAGGVRTADTGPVVSASIAVHDRVRVAAVLPG